MKKSFINLCKLAFSLAILGYLVRDVQTKDPETFRRLAEEPKNWGLLGLAGMAIFTSVVITHFRWYWLVRALGIPFRISDAFRLGFLGYMLNFVSLGSVGGDLFKAVFIAREQPGRRTEAVATIVVDRMVGMVALLLVASVGVLVADLTRFGPDIEMLGWATLSATAVLLAGFVLLLLPGWHQSRPVRRLRRIRRIGPIASRLIDAVYTYRQTQSVLWLTIGVSIMAHTIAVFGFYCIAHGLTETAPDLGGHGVIIPLALVSGVIPLPFGALGAFEFVVDLLYEQLGSDGLGLLVALSYRVITVGIAAVGAVYYIVSRREMNRVMQEAEEDSEPAIETGTAKI